MMNKIKRRWIFLVAAAIILLPSAAMAAQKTMTVHAWDRVIDVNIKSNIISFEDDLVDFSPSSSTTDAVKVDPINKSVSLGNSKSDACGVLWYKGDTYCRDGICDFGKGFNAYFEFTAGKDAHDKSWTLADGFAFSVIGGQPNKDSLKSNSLRGGPPPDKSLGELLCYAGSGVDGFGLRKPKFAIEFDMCASKGGMADYGCNCAGSNIGRCSDGTCNRTGRPNYCTTEQGRQDPSNNNHVAVMFWGNDNAGNCVTNSVPGNAWARLTYDDNTHGEGINGSELNPLNSTGSSGYCERPKIGGYHWMENGNRHRVRIEVIRSAAARTYEIKAWVGCEDKCCSASTCSSANCNLSDFQDLFKAYTTYAPKISRTVTLSSDLHEAFNSMIFGFTVGTGGWVTNVKIENFKLYFTP